MFRSISSVDEYRLSAAKYYDHYNLTTEFYTNPRTVNLSAYPTAKRHHISDLYTLAGHRKENLFVELLMFFVYIDHSLIQSVVNSLLSCLV